METDTNPYLIGCANGILDLEGSVFMEGAVDENVTFKMGHCPDMDAIPYIPYETVSDNPIYEEIDDFFAKLFPDEEQRTYMWRLLASCLRGRNEEQKFYNWLGAGANGKSKLAWLMRITFGDYAGSLPATVLTSKRGVEPPELTAVCKKRFIFMCEPDEHEPINLKIIKQLSHEDNLNAASIYIDPNPPTTIMGKTFMMSNTYVPINSSNNIIWRCICVVPFNSKFVDVDYPQYNPERNIFHRDKQLDEKMSQWRTYFFSKLVHIYKTEYCTQGLRPIPKIMSVAHNAYRESYDPFIKFYKSRIRTSDRTVGNNVPVRELFTIYNQWHDAEGANLGLQKLKNQDIISCMRRFADTIMVGDQDVVHNVMVFNSAEEANRWDEA